MNATSRPLDLLRENLSGANKVAKRLTVSLRRVADLMPLDAKKVDALGEDEEERIDAFIFRFNSLTAMVQDHITRGILICEEEDAGGSKRDQRHLMEKLGALKAELNFRTLAELRNRIAHHYPDDNEKQAEIINEIFVRSRDLLNGYNSALNYADTKIFANDLDIHPISTEDLPGLKRS